mgnify:FL=1
MGKLFAYLRVSSVDQAASGLGMTAQQHATFKRGELLGGDWSDKWFGGVHKPGMFLDEAVSAFRVPLAKRPAGKALLAALKPGDTIIIPRIDRAFRWNVTAKR